MKGWMLVLLAVCIPDITFTLNDRKYNISIILRLITFIVACIWG